LKIAAACLELFPRRVVTCLQGSPRGIDPLRLRPALQASRLRQHRHFHSFIARGTLLTSGSGDDAPKEPVVLTPRAEAADDWRAHVGDGIAVQSLDLARAREPGRGREANSPGEIPARGWADILWRVVWAVSDNRILTTSGGVAFFAVLAVFPAIAAVVSLYGLFADASTMGDHLSFLAGILPFGVLQVVADQIILVSKQGAETLGTAFIVSLLIAVASANSGIAALFDALNVVYNEREKRSFFSFYATTFIFTLGGMAFVIIAITGVIAAPLILRQAGFASIPEQIVFLLRWPILLVAVGVSLALVYRYGPSRRDARWRWISWGSIVASLLWIVASMMFSWYVATFDSYNRIYGSLGAGIGFMVWLWISAVIVLFGAQLNAETEHQTARDSTEGRPKPLGARGAMMADHVGKAHEE
jgi:membrane protein